MNEDEAKANYAAYVDRVTEQGLQPGFTEEEWVVWRTRPDRARLYKREDWLGHEVTLNRGYGEGIKVPGYEGWPARDRMFN
jgi:hypothetical protein